MPQTAADRIAHQQSPGEHGRARGNPQRDRQIHPAMVKDAGENQAKEGHVERKGSGVGY